MFNFFKKKSSRPPVNEERRKWLEDAFAYLFHEFDSVPLINRKIWTPTKKNFPFPFDGSHFVAEQTASILSNAMEIDFDRIELHFFTPFQKVIDSGLIKFHTELAPDEVSPLGLYWGKDESEKYVVSVDESLLSKPEELVATLAHEFSHIKLLGENRMDYVDEEITDLTALFFGFGIFNTNTAFKFSQHSEGWQYSNSGYLSQMDWGYALALFASARNEYEPEWAKFLNSTSQNDLKTSLKYIQENPDLIYKS